MVSSSSLVSCCISQLISTLDPDGGCELELAHFLMSGNVDSQFCHEYPLDELHRWLRSSQTHSIQARHQISWPGNWNEKQRKRGDLIERAKWEDDSFSFTILPILQTFSFMALFLRSHWKRYSQTFCYSNCITTISVSLWNTAFDLEWPTNSLQCGLQLVQNGPITWWRTWDMVMLYINMYISIFI